MARKNSDEYEEDDEEDEEEDEEDEEEDEEDEEEDEEDNSLSLDGVKKIADTIKSIADAGTAVKDFTRTDTKRPLSEPPYQESRIGDVRIARKEDEKEGIHEKLDKMIEHQIKSNKKFWIGLGIGGIIAIITSIFL